MPCRAFSWVTSTRPLFETSWIVRPPVPCDQDPPTARPRRRAKRPMNPSDAAVNQTSEPSGDQHEPLSADERLRDRPTLSGTVDDGDRARVVALNRVVQERDLVAVRRDPRVGDPAGGLVEDLPDGILEPDLPALLTNDGETLAVRGPVGPEHVLEDLLRRAAAGHPETRQRARPRERDGAAAVQRNGHLAGWRHGEHLGVREAEGTRLRTVEPGDEDLERGAVPTRRSRGSSGRPARTAPNRSTRGGT